MNSQIERRDFLNALGVTTVGMAASAVAGGAGQGTVSAAEPPKGKIPGSVANFLIGQVRSGELGVGSGYVLMPI